MQDEEAAHIGAEDVEVIYMTEMIADDGLLSEVLHMVSSVFECNSNLTHPVPRD